VKYLPTTKRTRIRARLLKSKENTARFHPLKWLFREAFLLLTLAACSPVQLHHAIRMADLRQQKVLTLQTVKSTRPYAIYALQSRIWVERFLLRKVKSLSRQEANMRAMHDCCERSTARRSNAEQELCLTRAWNAKCREKLSRKDLSREMAASLQRARVWECFFQALKQCCSRLNRLETDLKRLILSTKTKGKNEKISTKTTGTKKTQVQTSSKPRVIYVRETQ